MLKHALYSIVYFDFCMLSIPITEVFDTFFSTVIHIQPEGCALEYCLVLAGAYSVAWRA